MVLVCRVRFFVAVRNHRMLYVHTRLPTCCVQKRVWRHHRANFWQKEHSWCAGVPEPLRVLICTPKACMGALLCRSRVLFSELPTSRLCGLPIATKTTFPEHIRGDDIYIRYWGAGGCKCVHFVPSAASELREHLRDRIITASCIPKFKLPAECSHKV